MQTAQDVLAKERAYCQEHSIAVPRRAINRQGNAIAGFSGGRWVPVASQVLGRLEWVSMPYELLVNGKPITAAEDWIEVQS